MNTLSELPGFLDARRCSLPMDLAFAPGRRPFAAWQATLLALWRAGLPPHDAPATGTAERLRFATGAETSGRLMLPVGQGPHPAVLLLHEHGGRFDIGWEKMFGEQVSAPTRQVLYEGRAAADAFLNAGFAVLCLDAIGFGRRQAGGYQGQQALACNALSCGWSLAGITAAEDVQAALWLARQPGVDPARIGAFGFSWGGFRAWQVAALCPAIKAHASLSWMGCRADLMAPDAPLLAGQSAFHMLHPGLAHRADFPDLAGLCGGKPQFYRSGLGDRHMPDASVRRAWRHIATIARAVGAPPPDTAFHDAGHTCPSRTLDEAAAFLTHTT